MGGGRRSDSSSGEEDGDADWMAAINSVTSSAAHDSNGLPSSSNGGATHEDENGKHKPQKIKLYQIKAVKLLEDILDKTIEVVSERAPTMEEEGPAAEEDAGIRLFKSAPRGIVFDHQEELIGPKKKPRIVPGEELNEKSKKLRKQLQSVVVDGAEIIVAASKERQKALAKLEARENAAKTRAKREEDRVAELKRIRGERWLPCMAKEMRFCKSKIIKQ